MVHNPSCRLSRVSLVTTEVTGITHVLTGMSNSISSLCNDFDLLKKVMFYFPKFGKSTNPLFGKSIGAVFHLVSFFSDLSINEAFPSGWSRRGGDSMKHSG